MSMPCLFLVQGVVVGTVGRIRKGTNDESVVVRCQAHESLWLIRLPRVQRILMVKIDPRLDQMFNSNSKKLPVLATNQSLYMLTIKAAQQN